MPGKACLQLPLVLLFSFEIREPDFVGNKGRPQGNILPVRGLLGGLTPCCFTGGMEGRGEEACLLHWLACSDWGLRLDPSTKDRRNQL